MMSDAMADVEGMVAVRSSVTKNFGDCVDAQNLQPADQRGEWNDRASTWRRDRPFDGRTGKERTVNNNRDIA